MFAKLAHWRDCLSGGEFGGEHSRGSSGEGPASGAGTSRQGLSNAGDHPRRNADSRTAAGRGHARKPGGIRDHRHRSLQPSGRNRALAGPGLAAIDPDTGDEAGTTEGIFSFWWQGEVLYGRNEAVKDGYLLGWSRDPAHASETAANPDRSRILLWHVNYHPDGGQLFYPLDKNFLRGSPGQARR